MSFKIGDRVVRTVGRYVLPGTKGTLIQKDARYAEDWLVKTDNGGIMNWHKDTFVLEEVYDSPLYKVIQEVE